MSARLGAVRYGREQGDPFLGRSMGNQPDYSLEVAHEIDEEVRKLIEAAHTEAWEILNTYRDVLDDLVFELLQKETLTRVDLERIFDAVEKRPRITAFNDFGQRTPSDKPPIQTPGRARPRARRAVAAGHRAGPRAHARRLVPGWRLRCDGARAERRAAAGPARRLPRWSRLPGRLPARPAVPGRSRCAARRCAPCRCTPRRPAAVRAARRPAQQRPGPQPPNSVLPNYGAPPDWRPATTPVRAVVAAAGLGARPVARPRRSRGRATDAPPDAAGDHGHAPGDGTRPPVGRRGPELSTPGRERRRRPGPRGRPRGRPGRRARRRPGAATRRGPRPPIRELLIAVGEDPDRDGPARHARAGGARVRGDLRRAVRRSRLGARQDLRREPPRAGPGPRHPDVLAPASTTCSRSTGSRTSATSRAATAGSPG